MATTQEQQVDRDADWLRDERDARILDEQHQTERKVIRESTRPGERPYLRPSDTERAAEQRAVCNHAQLSVYVSYGSTFDDHETQMGYCRACDSFLTIVAFASGRTEERAMRPDELERCAKRAFQAGGR